MRLIALTLTLALGGCASTIAKWDAEIAAADAAHANALAAFERSIPTCSGDADCTAKWEAAQLFVQKNAGYKLQTVTSVVIETFGPSKILQDASNDHLYAFSVTKEPQGAGSYRIVASVSCQYASTCRASADDLSLAFNRDVSAAAP